MRGIHYRMPVILSPEDEARWLDPGASPLALQQLLRPAPEGKLLACPVNRAMNRVGYHHADCIAPLHEMRAS